MTKQYEKIKKEQSLARTLEVIPNSITKILSSVNKIFGASNSDHNYPNTMTDVSRVFTDTHEYYLKDAEIDFFPDEFEPHTSIKQDIFTDIVQQSINKNHGLRLKTGQITNVHHESVELTCNKCTSVYSLEMNYGELLNAVNYRDLSRFRSDCCEEGIYKDILHYSFDHDYNSLSLNYRNKHLKGLSNEFNFPKGDSITKKGLFDAYKFDDRKFKSLQRKLANNNSAKTKASVAIATRIMDQLNLPTEVISKDYDSVNIDSNASAPFTNALAFKNEFEPEYLLNVLCEADSIEFDFQDSSTDLFEEEYRYKNQFYPDCSLPDIQLSEIKIPIEIIKNAEVIGHKINCLAKAFKKSPLQAKKFLDDRGIFTGVLENPSKKVMLIYLKDQILFDIANLLNTEVEVDPHSRKAYYPRLSLNLFNAFDVTEEQGNDVYRLKKIKEALLTLHLENDYNCYLHSRLDRNKTPIKTSFDSMWRLKETAVVKGLDINYQDCIDTIRWIVGIGTSKKSTLNGIDDLSSFFLQRSWFSIIFPDLPKELKKVIKNEIEQRERVVK